MSTKNTLYTIDDNGASNTSPVLMLVGHEIGELLSMGEALKQVEYALRLEVEGRAIMPPKLYLDLPDYHGDFRAMPAYIDGSAGLKWVKEEYGRRLLWQNSAG